MEKKKSILSKPLTKNQIIGISVGVSVTAAVAVTLGLGLGLGLKPKTPLDLTGYVFDGTTFLKNDAGILSKFDLDADFEITLVVSLNSPVIVSPITAAIAVLYARAVTPTAGNINYSIIAITSTTASSIGWIQNSTSLGEIFTNLDKKITISISRVGSISTLEIDGIIVATVTQAPSAAINPGPLFINTNVLGDSTTDGIWKGTVYSLKIVSGTTTIGDYEFLKTGTSFPNKAVGATAEDAFIVTAV